MSILRARWATLSFHALTWTCYLFLNKGRFISNFLSKEAEIFEFFQSHFSINLAMCLGKFCRVFFANSFLGVLKGERHFWGPKCRKGKNGKFGEMEKKNQFSLLAAQFWMKRQRGGTRGKWRKVVPLLWPAPSRRLGLPGSLPCRKGCSRGG